ncbi:uncharacterized membrane protein At1g16860-like [Impatiens glandulifera]|uniref:uncharacterized membrane protein At1g16860-like n=1 Tax=Impatiens glandulifera TaxID=253017 RepID=UPI001FB079FE|nr:uncharacterized membrane protein At1g16860-like [Impatiens glandulifera]
MGSRILSHQLSNGLYVSGRPENLKDNRQPTMASRAVPYTGGDIKRSGDLAKMFDLSHPDQLPPTLKTSRPSSSSSQLNSGPVKSGASSGQLGGGPPAKSSGSGPIPRRLSGPMTPLQPTGLITSGPLGSSAGRRSGQLEPSVSTGKALYGSAVTHLNEEMKMGFKLSKPVMWVFVVVMFMAVLVGAFLAVAVKKTLILIVIGGIIGLVIMTIVWNCTWKKMGLLGFLKRYPDAELRGAIDGQCVKVTGVVTCGSIPLESSFQKTQRCVYVSTQLYEYKGCSSKSTIPKHHFFSWGCRHSERHIADFYISDFQTGLRALVKAGYGAKASVLVEPTKIVDVTKENRDLSPSFLKWLSDRSISSDNRTMRLKEGFIKEGSTVSVIGVVQRHENVLMIVPPSEPVSTGYQWSRCLLPTYVEGLVLTCDESQNNTDVIPV